MKKSHSKSVGRDPGDREGLGISGNLEQEAKYETVSPEGGDTWFFVTSRYAQP